MRVDWGKPTGARVKSGMILRPISHLSDGSYLAKIYKNP